jgi:hypothetical protein
MTPPGHGHLRASSADRERAADVLKAAFAEGRLTQDEYTERIGLAHESRTYADLAALTDDLPVGPLGTLFPGPLPGAMLPAVPAAPTAPPAPSYRPVSQLALLSLVFGLATFLFPVLPITLFPAVILGIAALARISTAGQRGVGLAAAGIGLALLGALGPTFGIFFLR